MPVFATTVDRAVLGFAALASALLCTSVNANPVVDFNISVLGGTAGPFNTAFSQNGTPTATPGVFNFNETGSPFPTGISDPIFNEWSISDWDFNADDDPAGSGASMGARLGAAFSITNNRPDGQAPGQNHLQFSILISMNVLTAGQPTSFFGNGGMTLNITESATGTFGELSTSGGPVWNYRINNTDAANLFPAGFLLGGSNGPTTASTSGNLSPAQTGPLAGMAPTSIGVRLDFDLTPGETVTFNGVWGYIPAPGALGLLALAGMVGRGRRRLA